MAAPKPVSTKHQIKVAANIFMMKEMISSKIFKISGFYYQSHEWWSRIYCLVIREMNIGMDILCNPDIKK